MARCPKCNTRIAPWRTLLPETKSRPLVCRECGAVLRMKPGVLVALGAAANVITQFVVRPVLHHSRGLGIAMSILLVLVDPICLYALFAPAERADALEGDRDPG